MLVVVIVLAAALAMVLIATLVLRSRLSKQRDARAAAEQRGSELAQQLRARAVELDAVETERVSERRRADVAEQRAGAAEERAATAEEQAAAATSRAMTAEEQAGVAEAARDAAQRAASDASELSRTATEMVSAAERTASGGLDPEVLWGLERARTERLWRENVAVGPTAASVFDGVDDPLRRALEVEVDAAREIVGAVIELEAGDLGEITSAGSLLVLRAAQELLAGVMHEADRTVLSVRPADGHVDVTVQPFDAEDAPIEPRVVELPTTLGLTVIPGGLRINDVVARPGERAGGAVEPSVASP